MFKRAPEESPNFQCLRLKSKKPEKSTRLSLVFEFPQVTV
ncbi:hypothetical protein LSS_20750 [Leptospira santarosai serovar Shermani str. LT 821]|uniref:Uncharacterized protein n=1 Tax=Leptospira santarosai serovar Shermani str. LT 821 TaxID=758847 RepID=A0A097ES89_9LEPT|nr:hypothetical protein LSS_20750 [Leptospira santarosai serovar Shermani str. LT 821]